MLIYGLIFLYLSGISDEFIFDETTTTPSTQANVTAALSSIAQVPCRDEGDLNCAVADEHFHVCSDVDEAKTVCRRHCNLCDLVDGNWAEWSPWSSCHVTCGDAQLARTRTCTNPAPANLGSNCTGADSEYKTCSVDPCPVHGGWSPWGSWGTCSASCGVGIQRRDRTCSNPPPQYLGDHCFGDSIDNRLCFPDQCGVHGGWGAWGSWGTCSVSCGVGIKRRDRTCSNPPPQYFGDQCLGDSNDNHLCFSGHCRDGGWSSWDRWSSCSDSCGVGSRSRQRYCDSPAPSLLGSECRGTPIQNEICGENADTCVVHTNGSCCVEYAVNQYDSADAYKVRLCDGNGPNSCNPKKGRVEVAKLNTMEWGTVCDNYWDRNDNGANVLCRSIGYRSGSNIPRIAGPSWLPTHLGRVICTGNESNIFSCDHYPWNRYVCDHVEDVSVLCE